MSARPGLERPDVARAGCASKLPFAMPVAGADRRAAADLAGRDRKTGDGYGEAAGTLGCSPPALCRAAVALRMPHALRSSRQGGACGSRLETDPVRPRTTGA